MYDSDEGLRDRTLPYLRAGLDRDEEVLAVVSARTRDVLVAALGPRAGRVRWDVPDLPERRLGLMLEGLRSALAQRRAAGVPSRLLAEYDLAAGGTGDPDQVVAYLHADAMSNEALGRYGLPWLCLYDSRRHDREVVAAARRIHPLLVDASGGIVPSPEPEPPAAFVRRAPVALLPVPHPVEVEVPLAVPGDVAAARAALRAWAQVRGMAAEEWQDIVLAANEVATNAVVHGGRPARLRAWIAGGRVVVRVDDAGSQPLPPTVGYLRPEGGGTGGGLWIARLLAGILAIDSGPAGTGVELRFDPA
ncbi:MAG TPA: sensor histidine kinase [Pseudonocardia sp.]|nr:sensor histidine kinase [Pseudonocardia sp.]